MAAYVFAEIEITDPATFDRYRPLAGASVERYGGTYIARGGRTVTVEGDWNPSRVVILAFDSVEAAQRWYGSPEYQECLPLRLASSTGKVIIVEGT